MVKKGLLGGKMCDKDVFLWERKGLTAPEDRKTPSLVLFFSQGGPRLRWR